MKTIILLLGIFVSFNTISYSQSNTFPSTGYSGIGTTSPGIDLEISAERNSHTQLWVRNSSLENNARAGFALWNGNGGGDYFAMNLTGKNYTQLPGWANRLTIQSGSQVLNGVLFYAAQGGIQFSTSGTNNPDIYVAPNGNVGFSTSNPASKLSVNGNVESKEIQVKANIADYVFREEYILMSLEDIEKFIIENKHLPNVFSEKNQIENNGNIPLGQISMQMLEKIEELTLHIIELNKRIKILENKNE